MSVVNPPRFSEDLDFAVEGNASDYDLGASLKSVRSLLAAENYRVQTRLREHRNDIDLLTRDNAMRLLEA